MDQAQEIYSKLGTKTLVVFVLKRSGILFLFVAMVFALAMLRSMISSQYLGVVSTVMLGILGAGIFVATIIFIIGWLEYSRYNISLTHSDLAITRGLFAEEEVGIPYRRIRDVNIERSIADQMLGTSNVTIRISGNDEEASHGNESVILPALDKDLAAHIQNELLKRAEVEEIHVESAAEK